MASPRRASERDPPLRAERGIRLAKAWDRLDPKRQGVMLSLIEETAGR